MINKAFSEYMEQINNMETNYKKIISKKKGVVKMKKKILNIAAVFLTVIILGVASTQIYAKIQWDIQFKEYQNREVMEAKANIEELINMEYVKQDGISAKVDSIILTDDSFDANISFKFDEDKVVNSETFGYGYAIYDENKNIYQIFSRMHLDNSQKFDNTVHFIYKELGIDYNKKDIYAKILSDSSGISNLETNAEDKTIVTNVNLRATDNFPISKKIYIRIFDLGYVMLDSKTRTTENFTISDAEWIFEIDVPEKLNNRKTVELKLESEIPGIEIQKLTLTETGMVLKFKSEEYLELISAGKDMNGNEFLEATKNMLSITDGEGNIYQDITGGTGESGIYRMTFDVGKKDLDKKLFIHFTINGEKYTSELVVK